MSDSIRETRSIMAKTNNFEKSITGMASWRIHPGWEIVYSEYQSNIKTKPPEYPLLEGSIWELDIKKDNPDLVSDQTKPPRRFSESSIVQQMKKAGIGRPSTYVSTIQTLNKRKYVENISGSLKPTEAGTIMWSEVVPFYNEQEDKKGYLYGFTDNYIKIKTSFNHEYCRTKKQVKLIAIDDDGIMKAEIV